MSCPNDTNRIFLHPYPTDTKNSFHSPSGITTNEMRMNVQNRDAFCCINKNLTNLKIPHAEFGELVIYTMRQERGTIQLPQITTEEPEQSKDTAWSELVLMVQGISPEKSEKRPRWIPKKKRNRNSYKVR